MFFEGDRIDAMREMILAETLEERKAALAKLLPYQREDFAGIFRALKGYPATIRFLDPPLHEFLPHTEDCSGCENVTFAGSWPTPIWSKRKRSRSSWRRSARRSRPSPDRRYNSRPLNTDPR